MTFINLVIGILVVAGPITLVLLHQTGWLTDRWFTLPSSKKWDRRL